MRNCYIPSIYFPSNMYFILSAARVYSVSPVLIYWNDNTRFCSTILADSTIICTIIYSLKICVPLSYFFVSIIKAMSVPKAFFYFLFSIIYSTYVPSRMFVHYSLPSLHLTISLISEEFFK